MPADIVNLRKARKARARVEKEKRAEENRAKFGRPKVERLRIEAEKEAAVRRLDSHKRGGKDDDPDDGGA